MIAPDPIPVWGTRPDWHTDAICSGTDPERWFPSRGESTGDATKVCRSCPVRAECLSFAMTSGEKFGIWGGLAERPRRTLRRDGRVMTRDDLVVFDQATGAVMIEALHVEPVAVAG